MKTYLDCLPCVMNQALKAARAATADAALQREVLDEVAALIPGLSLDIRPPEIAQVVHRLVRRVSGNADPFRREKEASNRAALKYYPALKKTIAAARDPLLAACHLAIAGNTIDLGPQAEPPPIEDIVNGAFKSPLAVDDYAEFRRDAAGAERILYLGDNAGEIVCDRLLIEELCRERNPEISFVVRGEPVINDATTEDALECGLDKVAAILSNGSDAPATILSQCSPELRRLYDEADLIIAKGQGNYESLDEEPGNIFFFLRAKCAIVAEARGVNIGDAMLLGRRR